MIDIDYFTNYNDIDGHLAGDQCLKEVAREILRFSLAENIYSVRYGGEELRASIAAHQDITISIGLYIQSPNSHTNIDEYVNAADKALYEAKARGRNCCVVYNGT